MEVTYVNAFSANSKVYDQGNYFITYEVVNEWDGYQNIQISVTNTGNEPISNWALGYNAVGEIIGLWNAQIYGQQGTEYILKNLDHNAQIANGMTAVLGYTLKANKPAFPSDIRICAERTSIDGGYEAYLNVIGDYGNSYNAEIVIVNNTGKDISGWQLAFDGNMSINNIWNARFLSSNGGQFLFANSDHDVKIANGQTLRIGFSGEKNITTKLIASNFKLTAISIPLKFGFDDEHEEVSEDTYIPWLPIGLDNIVAYGEHNSEINSIIVEWAFGNNQGNFRIYEHTQGKTLIEQATNYNICVVLIEEFKDEYRFTVEHESGGKTLVSNEVIMRLNGNDYYTFEYTDSDNDMLPDLNELILGTELLKADTDGDNLLDGYEYNTLGTDPLKYDTLGEGKSDGEYDFDSDRLTNSQEYLYETDPFASDTDNDFLTDYEEIFVHFTEPIVADTDEDIINDGDEISLGLDPNNPQTFGYPDGEYTVEQIIDIDSPVFDFINNIEDKPFDISLEINSAGVAENNISVAQSGYSHQILQNEAVVGTVPEFVYKENLTVDDVWVYFNIGKQASVELNAISTFNTAASDINKYTIFKYFEDNDLLLPIETFYDNEKSQVYAHTDELGTYCLIDMDKLVSDVENSSAGYYNDIDSSNENPPANIVFSVDVRGTIDTLKFNETKESIKSISEEIFQKYNDVKVYVYYQVLSENFEAIHKFLEGTDEMFFTELDDIEAALENLETYPVQNDFSNFDFVNATKHIIDECDENVTAIYHIVSEKRITGELEEAKELIEYIADNDRIHISVLCPYGMDNMNYSNASYAFDLVEKSNGFVYPSVEIAESEEKSDSKSYLNSISLFSEEKNKRIDSPTIENIKMILGSGGSVSNKFKVISATDLKDIKLDAPLEPDEAYFRRYEKPSDTDSDGLSDWKEVNIQFIVDMLVKSGKTVGEQIKTDDLPTLNECLSYYDWEDYVSGAKNQLEFKYRDFLRESRILPLISDPTSIDGDDDNFLDNAFRFDVGISHDNLLPWVEDSEYFNLSDKSPLKTDVVWMWPVVSKDAVDTSDGEKVVSKEDGNGSIKKNVFMNAYKTKNLQSSFVEVRGTRYHKAIDISPKDNDNKYYIIASQSGIVYATENGCNHISSANPNSDDFNASKLNGCGCGGGWGNYIAINSCLNANQYTTLYAHLEQDSLLVKEGDYVSKGTIIAIVGSSGNSTGHHLDFSIRDGSSVVPKRIDSTCYDPILFNQKCDSSLSDYKLDFFMSIPKDIVNTCSVPSDGCADYFDNIIKKYNLRTM
jgi:hypothetical protein